jgi:conjugative transfer region protein TrbK
MSALTHPRLWRVVVALTATAAVAVTTLVLARRSLQSEAPAPRGVSSDMSSGLDRCRGLGSAAQDDAACREVWRRARERFLRSSGEGRP